MKRSYIVAGVVFILITFSVYLMRSLNLETRNYWSRKADYYRDVSDSLREAVDNIEVRLQARDSILLSYMHSLDKTLEELDRESQKNRAVLRENFRHQDSIRASFCKQMATLDQRPEECK